MKAYRTFKAGAAVLTFALAASTVFAALPATAYAEEATSEDSLALNESATRSMYRLYNPNSGEHFYTADATERDHLKSVGWRYEGIGWIAATWATSGKPVYRLYSGTDHHYTMSSSEKDNLVKQGWEYEGIGWYSDEDKGVPLYRQYNPNVNPAAKTNNSGSHNYTTSKAENDRLVSVGWKGEGIAWYGVKTTTSSSTSSSSNKSNSSSSKKTNSTTNNKSNSSTNKNNNTTNKNNNTTNKNNNTTNKSNSSSSKNNTTTSKDTTSKTDSEDNYVPKDEIDCFNHYGEHNFVFVKKTIEAYDAQVLVKEAWYDDVYDYTVYHAGGDYMNYNGTFQTTDEAEVLKYCHEHRCSWTDQIITKRIYYPAEYKTVRHPKMTVVVGDKCTRCGLSSDWEGYYPDGYYIEPQFMAKLDVQRCDICGKYHLFEK